MDKITLNDFEPAELTTDVLDALCQQDLGLSVREVVSLAPLLKAVENLLGDSIKGDRLASLVKASVKPDPLDCSYVRKCIIELLKREKDFVRLKELVRILNERLG